MGKREIFEEIDYLVDLLAFYKVHENPESHEDLINTILDRILYLRKLVEDFN
ncbi:hypothetical protein FACS189451_06570 [Bacteroidia bacterium]|nr:hypothetical protein FACS189446_2360 [Bacteroidia bacterium]GHT62376.1 hypothetical protein FACS189451_06570 [Bacteroidia bacterium]